MCPLHLCILIREFTRSYRRGGTRLWKHSLYTGVFISLSCRARRRSSSPHIVDSPSRCVLIIAGLGARGRTEFFQHVCRLPRSKLVPRSLCLSFTDCFIVTAETHWLWIHEVANTDQSCFKYSAERHLCPHLHANLDKTSSACSPDNPEEQPSPTSSRHFCSLPSLFSAQSKTGFVMQIIAHFASLKDATGEDLLSVCTYDSRGIGGSTTPQKLGQYSTKLMAEDALGLLDHLGWKQAHIIGLSLGGTMTSLMSLPPAIQSCISYQI